jgi:hypothetical protein
VGASVRELLRQTDPRRARFLDARSGYVAIPAAFGSLTGVFSHDIATTEQLGPATFDCLADILGAAGVRVARARLAARAEDALASTLAFYGDKMAGAAAAVVARVVAAAGPRSYPLASSVHDANDAADTAIAEASRVFAEASFFAEMREGCVDAGHASLASRVLASSTAARRREFARGARRAREAAATLFLTRAEQQRRTDVLSDVSVRAYHVITRHVSSRAKTSTSGRRYFFCSRSPRFRRTRATPNPGNWFRVETSRVPTRRTPPRSSRACSRCSTGWTRTRLRD